MEQHINKINATTRDYRGNKSILNQRVIEGVSTAAYDLSTDLQLEENTPKTITIDNIENGNIYLPNAQTLLSGWKITIINESTTQDCDIYYYNTTTIFTSVAKNRMTELLFLGQESNDDEIGKWKVVILSESVVNDTDIYTTNLYSKTKVDYTDLGSSFTHNVLLAKLTKNNPIKSVYVKTNDVFEGVNVNLNIGLVNNLKYFYQDLDLTQDLTQRDLFNEIVDANNDQYIIGNFIIPGATTNAWTAITSNIPNTDNITSAYFGNGHYVLQANDTLYSINSLTSTITFGTKSISDFGFDSYSEYSLQYEETTNTFYFFGVKDNRLCYTTSTDGLIWVSELTINEEFEIDNIKYITKIYNENNDKWFITATVDSNAYVIYLDDITTPSTWSLYESKYNDTFITNVNNITCDFSHLIINTDSASYYSIDNGVTLNLLESYSGTIYKIKYINNTWIRFPYNDVNGYSFKYIFDFNNDINSWIEKEIPDNIINTFTVHVNYILDINYNEGLWTIFRAYQALEDEKFNLIISTDFFNTITPIGTSSFNGNELTCICGNGNDGYLVTGENGTASYSNVSSSFISLTGGSVEITIEYAESVNPVNLLNPIIQGQIMPLGTVIYYPFARTIPAGYVRLDGTKIKNVKNDFPEFYDLLQRNPQMIYGGNSPIIQGDCGSNYNYYDISKDNSNNSAWKNLVKNSDGNYAKFVWVNDNDIRTPVIDCFIRGFVGDITTDFAQYYQDAAPNITGRWASNAPGNYQNGVGGAIYTNDATISNVPQHSASSKYGFYFDASRSSLAYGRANEVRPKNITYPYIMAYYHTVQEIGTYNLQTLGLLLDKLDADIILAQNTVNDLTRKVPAGTIAPFAGNTLPEGWLWCNGNSYFRSTYNELFDKIGTIYGDDGGNPEKFNVPKIDDNRFIEGVNNNENNKKNAGLPNITGTLHWWYTGGLDKVDGAFAADSYRHADGGGGGGNNSIGVTFNASRSSSIYGNSSTVQPKAIRLRYIIKY